MPEAKEERAFYHWPGRALAEADAARPAAGQLVPVPEESVDWDNTRNLYFEGDNLEVLRHLREQFREAVRLIYIDPPYNTGNELLYRDGLHRSDWCSMIYPRLLLSRELLTPDGAIFISIGEQELGPLLCLCDEIFTPDARLAIFNRITKRSSNSGNHFSPCVDYVLVYAKDPALVPEYRTGLDPHITARYRRTDAHAARRGPYQEVGLYMAALKHGGSHYPIECPDGTFAVPPDGRPWRWNEASCRRGLAEDRIVFKRTSRSPLIDPATGQRSAWNIYTKVYLREREVQGMHPKNFSDAYQNALAAAELRELGIPFDFAKPTALVRLFCMLQTGGEDLVLDFFAGSSTTGDAVMQCNAEDGGRRRFIMVQRAEPCDPRSAAARAGFSDISAIGKERLRRAGARLRRDHPDTAPDTGFRVYRLEGAEN
ncbi:MAG: site-specific DNA-methyltransferase [Oscillospiraceae bacterium]|nr:site-specific DNA-methyltransferase [Oscillospiraceae bacterium]